MVDVWFVFLFCERIFARLDVDDDGNDVCEFELQRFSIRVDSEDVEGPMGGSASVEDDDGDDDE